MPNEVFNNSGSALAEEVDLFTQDDRSSEETSLRYPYAVPTKFRPEDLFRLRGDERNIETLSLEELIQFSVPNVYLTPEDKDPYIANACVEVLKGRYLYDAETGREYFWSLRLARWVYEPKCTLRLLALLLHPRFSASGNQVKPPLIRPIAHITKKSDKDAAREAALGSGIAVLHKDYGLAFAKEPSRPFPLVFTSERMMSVRALENVAKLVQLNPKLKCSSKDFDKCYEILPTPTEYILLDSDELTRVEPHPKYRFTRTTAVAPSMGQVCGTPAEKVMAQIFPDVEQRQAFQRALGAALRNYPGRKNVYVCYGSGSNGKSAMARLVSTALGELCGTFSKGVMQPRGATEHATIYTMAGEVNVAFTMEPDRLRAWDTEVIKQLSGGDPMTARKMYQDEYTFIPSATMFVLANNLPTIRDSDAAFYNRVKVFHMSAHFAESQEEMREGSVLADPNLIRQIEEDPSDLLSWILEGLQDYKRRGGFDFPLSVRASSMYARESGSVFTAFAHEVFNTTDEADEIPIDVAFKMWEEYRARTSSNPRLAPNAAKYMRPLADELGITVEERINGKTPAKFLGIVPSDEGRDIIRALYAPGLGSSSTMNRSTKDWLKHWVEAHPTSE